MSTQSLKASQLNVSVQSATHLPHWVKVEYASGYHASPQIEKTLINI